MSCVQSAQTRHKCTPTYTQNKQTLHVIVTATHTDGMRPDLGFTHVKGRLSAGLMEKSPS